MARKRKQEDLWMPVNVNRTRSAYDYRPTPGICIRLCGLDSSKALVIRRHAEEFERLHTKSGTVKALADLYFESEQFRKLAPRTQKDYLGYWEKLDPVFGKADAKKVEAKNVRAYLDGKGKKSGEVQANRCFSLLSKVFSWGFERGKVVENPCAGVTRYSETARDRYIEDEEYNAVFEHAPDAVRAAMEISYLCGARQGDVLKLTKSDLKENGIFIRQGKTGKKQIKAWTADLRKAVALAAAIKTKIDSFYVIPTLTGTAYTSTGFRSMWHKARDKARTDTGLVLDFTFHDIKAKGISDFEGDKQRFSGHKTAAQVATYDRKTQIVETLNRDK